VARLEAEDSHHFRDGASGTFFHHAKLVHRDPGNRKRPLRHRRSRFHECKRDMHRPLPDSGAASERAKQVIQRHLVGPAKINRLVESSRAGERLHKTLCNIFNKDWTKQIFARARHRTHYGRAAHDVEHLLHELAICAEDERRPQYRVWRAARAYGLFTHPLGAVIFRACFRPCSQSRHVYQSLHPRMPGCFRHIARSDVMRPLKCVVVPLNNDADQMNGGIAAINRGKAAAVGNVSLNQLRSCACKLLCAKTPRLTHQRAQMVAILQQPRDNMPPDKSCAAGYEYAHPPILMAAFATMKPMTLTINGEKREFAGDLTLAELVAQLGMKADRLAIELNLEIVQRGRWNTTRLREGDRLEIVHFVGGGAPSK
jgi:sulfur carrier protein